ncbi:MAG: hypothetical protein GF353_05050 [Candidatus Lokiarchaeota archaeon]|nr:hypothetical protein [Candidatus Lokiarchaeota archaeon]
MDRDSIEYMKTVLKYSKSDIEELINIKLKVAGPYLAVISNGIDVFGGFYFGFKDNHGNNSKKRSFRFMRDIMGLNEFLSAFLYIDVRCGIVHHGIAKKSVAIFTDYNRIDKGEFIYKDDDRVYINVVEFAYKYLDTLEKIEIDLKNFNSFPVGNTNGTRVPDYDIKNIKSNINRNLCDYWGKRCRPHSYYPYSPEEIPIVRDSPSF